MHLKSTDNTLNVTGISMPGVPGIIMGHNGYAAWSITLSYNDVEDLYQHKFTTWDEKNNIYKYLYDGKERNATVIHEIIKIPGKEDKKINIVMTHQG